MKLNNEKISKFPYFGYLGGYFITKFFNTFEKFSFFLERLESMMLKEEINKFNINKPIYITGLARSGTTILLEMLEKHPDLATHQYKHFIMPYLPSAIENIFATFIKIKKSFERIHQDGIIVSSNSPEAIEEIFWQKFFDDTHDEKITNVFNKEISNPKFEIFYRNHIKKLMISQNCSRYLAKNNYNITRLEYLIKIFPNSRFLLTIRNPVDQIASLIKQSKLFLKLESNIPFLKEWLKIIGHQEFGHNQVCINIGNYNIINKIRSNWNDNKSYVKGWAYYWTSIYNFVAKLLDNNYKLRNATLIVKYDELCENSEKVINKILKHSELSIEHFNGVIKQYVKRLHNPTYYKLNFSKQDINDINTITKTTATRFNLDIKTSYE